MQFQYELVEGHKFYSLYGHSHEVRNDGKVTFSMEKAKRTLF